MSERKWTDQQQHCIDDRGGTLLVSAAAGSGKTSVLVERIIQRITDPDHPLEIDRLLVVTFTKAAAAEMKQRIAKALSDRLKEEPDNTHLQKQQLALPRAAISTVHSFCINLVRENAFLLDLPPKFALAEEQQLLLLRKEALQETLDTCYRESDPAFSELADMLSNGKNDGALGEAVETIYDFVQSHPYPDHWLKQMETVYDDTLPMRDTVWGQILLEQLHDLVSGSLQLLRGAVELCDGTSQWCGKYRPALQADVACLTTLDDCLRGTASWDTCFSRALNFHPTAVTGVRKGEDESIRQRVVIMRDQALKQLKKIPDLYCGTEEQCRAELRQTRRIVGALYGAVGRFSAIFSQKKREKELLDFNDAEHFALRLLTTPDENGVPHPTPLAAELSQQFDEIMVDEYQDTNASQDALFSALSRNETNLFYVGDVKQSIYRFRKAMPQLFIDRRSRYAPYESGDHPATISLGNNFRSRREVTDSINFLFRQLMSQKTGGIEYDEREELVYSANYDEQPGHETECLIVEQRELRGTGIHLRTAEARLIAEKIRHCMTVPCVTDGGEHRPARYGDFCILLRSPKSQAADYRNELERQGIPVAYETPHSFLETAEIRLAMSLLRCIDNPGLDIPLTATLVSPLFGFSPEDLAQIRLFRRASCLYVSVCAARRHPDPSLANRCTAFLAWLDRYRLLAATLTVDALVRRLYEDTVLPELLSTRAGGESRRKNLLTLHDICRRFEQNGFRGLSAFIRHVDRLQEQNADLLPRPAASSVQTGDAVRILSIHGSKGLEFPIVFMAGLGSPFNNEDSSEDLLLHPTLGAAIKLRDPKTFNRFKTLPLRALSIAIRNDAREEDLRILYVALTRAREKLYIFASPRGDALKYMTQCAAMLTDNGSLPAPLVRNATSMAQWILLSLLRHPSAGDIRQQIGYPDLAVLPAQTPWQIQLCGLAEERPAVVEEAPVAGADPGLTALIREHMAYTYPHGALARVPAKLAASAAAHAAVADETIALSRPSFMGSSGLTPSERGIAMHTFMQFASYESAAGDPLVEAERLVRDGFLTPEQADSLDIRRLSAFFRSDLYAHMNCSPRCLREYHFTGRLSAADIDITLPDDTDEFVVVQGIADCVFEENGKLVIVDYKTDRVRTPEELAGRYRPQLAIYRTVIAKALEMPVGECLLYSFALGQVIAVD